MSVFGKVEVVIDVALGGRDMTLGDVLKLHRGALIEIERPGPGMVNLMVGMQSIGQARIDFRAGELSRIAIEKLGHDEV